MRPVTARSRNGTWSFRLRKGRALPIDGAPEQVVDEARPATSVALVTADYPRLRARRRVREGERVALGQPLFEDRDNAGVLFTSPGAGLVSAIHRGARRELLAVVVDLDGSDEVTFAAHDRGKLADLARTHVRETLLASGLWTSLRTRPFGRVPAPASEPHALFVAAIDTNPLAPAPDVVIAAEREAFVDGLTVLGRLLDGPIYLCTAPASAVPVEIPTRVEVARFAGPHPAGLVGTHIHMLSPVGLDRTAWYVGYQDVVAVGRLFTSGRLFVERTVSLAGPVVRRPRLVRTRLGASTRELVANELLEGECRVISGSVLSGRTASGSAAFLGRYHLQISAIGEDRAEKRHPIRWTTALHGARRAMVPVEAFQRMVPLDILVAPLLRALLTGDDEAAKALGCLELEEEDLALCTYHCPGKNEYGPLLRGVLDRIAER